MTNPDVRSGFSSALTDYLVCPWSVGTLFGRPRARISTFPFSPPTHIAILHLVFIFSDLQLKDL